MNCLRNGLIDLQRPTSRLQKEWTCYLQHSFLSTFEIVQTAATPTQNYFCKRCLLERNTFLPTFANKYIKANLQRNLKLCRWDATSSAFARCNQKYVFLRLVEYEKMLDKDFHVFYTNVIFVICLKRFLCRVFIPFSPSECADFLTWYYYQLGQEVVSHEGCVSVAFHSEAKWNSKPSLFQPLQGGSFQGHIPLWDWQIAHCCESPKELWRELKLNITVNYALNKQIHSG